MSRLPVVGGDSNTWGDVLNSFLDQGHNAGGTTKNIIGPVFNVTDDAYGADSGASAATNSAAFRAARDDANAAGYGTVIVPAGDYSLEVSEVTPNGHSAIAHKDGVHWLGIGKPRLTIPVFDGGAGGEQSVFGGAASDWSIQGFRLYGSNTGASSEQSHFGLYVRTVTAGATAQNFLISDCDISGFQSKGIFIGGNGTVAGTLPSNPVRLFGIRDVYIHDNAHGNALACADGAYGFTIDNVWMVNSFTLGAAEALIFTGYTELFSISNCVTYEWANWALGNSYKFNLSNNKIQEPAFAWIALYIIDCSDGVISGNVADGSLASREPFLITGDNDNLKIVENTFITNHTVNANVEPTSLTNSRIVGNKFVGGGTSKFHGDFTGTKILDNYTDTDFAIDVGDGTGGTTLGASVRGNSPGYKTENEGTETIASGSTSVAVTHGLNGNAANQGTQKVVSPRNIEITPTNNPTNDPGHIWVDSLGATTFTVHCRTDPGAGGLTFAWRVVAPDIRN